MPVTTPRRFYLLKARAADGIGELGLAGTWRAKQVGTAGTPLAEDFPLRVQLAAVGYSTVEDLTGADIDELAGVGLRRSEARAVLDALANL